MAEPWQTRRLQLRDFDIWQRSLTAFDWLPDGITGGTDLDLCIEHRGGVLIIETKPREGPKIYVPLGQWLTLRSLASKPGVDVWLIAEDEEAKADVELPHYSRLRVGANMKPHFEGNRNGQRSAGFYTDSRFDFFNLQQLQAEINSWWAAQ